MNDNNRRPEDRAPAVGEKYVAIGVALLGFAYLTYRLIATWGQWPEDRTTAALRITELALIAGFVLWMLIHLRSVK